MINLTFSLNKFIETWTLKKNNPSHTFLTKRSLSTCQDIL